MAACSFFLLFFSRSLCLFAFKSNQRREKKTKAINKKAMRLNKASRTKFAKKTKRKKNKTKQKANTSIWCYLNSIIGLYLHGDQPKINNRRDDSISIKHNEKQCVLTAFA